MNQEKLILDYGELVSVYWDNLSTTLRKFHPGAEVLDTWVPDENHIKSIINLLDAAQLAEQDNIEIFINASMLETINVLKLQEAASEFGDVSLKESSGGKTLEVSHLLKLAELGKE